MNGAGRWGGRQSYVVYIGRNNCSSCGDCFWQTLRSRELSAGIQSLQTNLDRTRTNLATDELESNELEHQLTLLRVEVGSLKNRVESLQHYQDILDASYFAAPVSIPIMVTAFGDIITWEKNTFIKSVKYKN